MARITTHCTSCLEQGLASTSKAPCPISSRYASSPTGSGMMTTIGTLRPALGGIASSSRQVPARKRSSHRTKAMSDLAINCCASSSDEQLTASNMQLCTASVITWQSAKSAQRTNTDLFVFLSSAVLPVQRAGPREMNETNRTGPPTTRANPSRSCLLRVKSSDGRLVKAYSSIQKAGIR